MMKWWTGFDNLDCKTIPRYSRQKTSWIKDRLWLFSQGGVPKNVNITRKTFKAKLQNFSTEINNIKNVPILQQIFLDLRKG